MIAGTLLSAIITHVGVTVYVYGPLRSDKKWLSEVTSLFNKSSVNPYNTSILQTDNSYAVKTGFLFWHVNGVGTFTVWSKTAKMLKARYTEEFTNASHACKK